MALPADVRRFFGYALSLAQAGDQHDAAKMVKGFDGAGVLEIVEHDRGGTYCAVYTVKFEEAVFVLHCFQKKRKSGIATPKEDLAIICARLKVAEAFAKELRNEETSDYMVSRCNAALAMFSLTWACRMPTRSRSSPGW